MKIAKKNSNKLIIVLSIFSILLILSGMVVMFYPTYTDLVYQQKVHEQYVKFNSAFEKSNEDAVNSDIQALYEELVSRNNKLFNTNQQDLKDPFSYEQPDIDLSKYGIKDNTIGFVSIPKIDVYLPILLGANTDNLAKGAAHLTNTSYPIGGINTNCIIAGHRGYRETAMFRGLYDLETGDKIFIENFKEKLTYKVIEIKQILPYEVDELTIVEGKDMVTLFTCAPFGYNTHRLLVRCERIENVETNEASKVDAIGSSTVKLWTGAKYVRIPKVAIIGSVFAVTLVIILIIIFIKRRIKRADS